MNNHTPYLVGLTGGIGSGKSTVSAMFRELGVEVMDTDVIARELVCPGSPLLQAIRKHFGAAVMSSDGTLNRAALRDIVFQDLREKDWLEKLLHPAIRSEIADRIRTCEGDYVILVVPLLMETGDYNFLDRILVVDVPSDLQVARACQRDGSDEKLINKIIATQVSRQERLQRADDIIDNSVSLEDLQRHVRQLHAQYQQAARQGSAG